MRYVINTSAAPEHVGGNEKLAAAATFRRAGGAGGFGGADRDLGTTATIVAHEGVLAAMSTPPKGDAGAVGGVAERDLLRRVPQAVGIRERRAGRSSIARQPPTPTATASCSSATPK